MQVFVLVMCMALSCMINGLKIPTLTSEEAVQFEELNKKLLNKPLGVQYKIISDMKEADKDLISCDMKLLVNWTIPSATGNNCLQPTFYKSLLKFKDRIENSGPRVQAPMLVSIIFLSLTAYWITLNE